MKGEGGVLMSPVGAWENNATTHPTTTKQQQTTTIMHNVPTTKTSLKLGNLEKQGAIWIHTMSPRFGIYNRRRRREGGIKGTRLTKNKMVRGVREVETYKQGNTKHKNTSQVHTYTHNGREGTGKGVWGRYQNAHPPHQKFETWETPEKGERRWWVGEGKAGHRNPTNHIHGHIVVEKKIKSKAITNVGELEPQKYIWGRYSCWEYKAGMLRMKCLKETKMSL